MGKLGWKHVLYSLLLVLFAAALVLYAKNIVSGAEMKDATFVERRAEPEDKETAAKKGPYPDGARRVRL